MTITRILLASATLALGAGTAFAQQANAPAPDSAATPATPATPADPSAGTAATPATPATPADAAQPAAKDPLSPATQDSATKADDPKTAKKKAKKPN